MKIQLLN